MNRRPIIAGNWKMNTTLSAATALVTDLAQSLKGQTPSAEVVVCPPFPFLMACKAAATQSGIKIGAQDVHYEKNGAFTGDISAEMLTSIQCDYVIIGHSERRQYHHESNESLNKKIKAALTANLHVIFCIGESDAQRSAGETFSVLITQLTQALSGIESLISATTFSVAYEPIWAIGTGKVATKEQAQDAHQVIRQTLAKLLSKDAAETIRILYGGSVKADNAKDLLSQPDIDGALVGGASLTVAQFLPIIESI